MEGIIEIKEIEPDVVQALLYYIYTFDYQGSEVETTLPEVIFHVHVHIAADRFGFPKLGRMAADSFEECARYGSDENPEALASAIELAYNCGPDHEDRLREYIIDVVTYKPNIKKFYTTQEYAMFREVTGAIPAFNTDLVARLINQEPHVTYERHWCGGCDKIYGAPHSDDEVYHCIYCGLKAAY